METAKLKFPFFDGDGILHPVGTVLTREDGVIPKSAKRLGENPSEDEPELPLRTPEPKSFSEMNKAAAHPDLDAVDKPTTLSSLKPSTASKARAKAKKGKA